MANEDLQNTATGATNNDSEHEPTDVGNDDGWNALLQDDEEQDLVIANEAPAEEAKPAEVTEEAQPVAAAEEVPPAEPAKTDVVETSQSAAAPKPDAVPSEPVKPAEPAAPKKAEQTQEELAAQRKKWREESEAKLAQLMASRFSPEDIEALRMEPEKVLPALLARTSMDMYDAVVQSMQSQMPQAVAMYEMQRQQARQAEETFFSAWPQLKKPEYGEVVGRTVQLYRQMNPQATLEQTVKEAGAMAMVALRLPLEQQPVQQAAPPVEQAKPFTPASPGGGVPVTKPVSGKSDNPFTQLAEEMLNDD